MNKMNKWDEKAKNYSRYSACNNSFEANVLKTIKKMGISFRDKNIIDIGCGTGVYTLHIAQIAKKVVGIDYSINMLEILKEDSKKLNIKNIETHHSTWSDFNTFYEIFDIAICTMSPAVKHKEEIEKFHKCAQKKIYLGWAGTRDCTILDELFIAHKEEYSPPNGAKRIRKWLDSKNIKFKVENFDELKIRKRSFEEAVENYNWHLKARGVKPDLAKIKETVEKFCDEDGNITEQTINKMDLIIW